MLFGYDSLQIFCLLTREWLEGLRCFSNVYQKHLPCSVSGVFMMKSHSMSLIIGFRLGDLSVFAFRYLFIAFFQKKCLLFQVRLQSFIIFYVGLYDLCIFFICKFTTNYFMQYNSVLTLRKCFNANQNDAAKTRI